MTHEACDATGWTRVSIVVPSTDPVAGELAAALLWAAGAAGVEEREQPGETLLLGGFPARHEAEAAAARAGTQGFDAVVEAITDDGLDGWREWATAERAGRFWITPTWVDAPALGEGEEVLWVDPGPTFGSGSHPTTRLVLALVPDLVEPTTTVLDVGCGSGVLAIGAALAGAPAALATDIDPASPAVVAANADANGVGSIVRATTAPVADLAAAGQRFQLVLANLLAPVIADVGPDLVCSLAPGGALVISGLLADRWKDTLPSVAPLAVEQVVSEDGWVAVVLR